MPSTATALLVEPLATVRSAVASDDPQAVASSATPNTKTKASARHPVRPARRVQVLFGDLLPSAASARAVASPMPDDAPLTTTTRPELRSVLISFVMRPPCPVPR